MHRVCMQDFYTCLPGHEEAATAVIHNRARKLVKDMHYEAQVQCVINYIAIHLNRRIKKEEARTVRLTREQYMLVHLDLFNDLVHCFISSSYMSPS